MSRASKVDRLVAKVLDSAAVDELYGLEPVYEPAQGGAHESTELVAVTCPYCGETFETVVDLSSGSFGYIEDCHVCCQPIELEGVTDECGVLASLTASRSG